MLLYFLLACGDVKPTDADTAVEPSSDPIDTGIEEEEEIFEPALFTMYGAFGLENGVLRSFFVDDTEVRPHIQLAFYTEDQDFCSVAAFMEPDVVATTDWEFEDVTDSENPVMISQQGFFLPPLEELEIVLSEGCADWDPDVFGDLEDKLDHAWGLGFGGPMRIDVETAIQDAESETLVSLYENDYLIGGSWSSNLWEPASWASHAFTVSPHEDWYLSIEENGYPTAYYSASEIEAGIDSGVYILSPIFLWSYDTFF